jgi:hypothetical protein
LAASGIVNSVSQSKQEVKEMFFEFHLFSERFQHGKTKSWKPESFLEGDGGRCAVAAVDSRAQRGPIFRLGRV